MGPRRQQQTIKQKPTSESIHSATTRTRAGRGQLSSPREGTPPRQALRRPVGRAVSAPGGKDGGRLGLHSVAPIVNVPPYHCLRSLSMPWRTEGPRPERLVSSRLQPGQRPGAGHHGAHLARGGRSGEVGLGPGWGRSHRAWSDGTHCVFCMLFSIPFHPLPELSVHGLEGKEVTQPIKTRQPAPSKPTCLQGCSSQWSFLS